MKNKWKEIWEKRTDRFDEIDMNDPKAIFLELKRIDGFDVVGEGMSYEVLLKQNNDIIKYLSKYDNPNTIFDVGCGCGANMYLFQNEGFGIGGMDYSTAQIEIAGKLFKTYGDNLMKPLELICEEAINIPTDIKYDSVVANSVFSYFEDETYAENVLNKILLKAKKSIGLIDLHDIEKKDAFEEYRRKTIDDYEVKYKDLHKFFYRREFFYNWAVKNGLEIEFHNSQVEGYWNNEFVFDVYMYKSMK